jgi:hypothetical protein
MLHKWITRLASLKIAIPLLVLLTAFTVIGSLFPQPDLFGTWWYLALLGVLGLSLLLITILHIPRILRRKGRNALIGVIMTHAGILVLIAGAMVGGFSSTRWQFHAIEGEMTVIRGMPFVVELESLDMEEYPPETFAHMDLALVPKMRQDSHLALYRQGQLVAELTTAPGRPVKFDGYTILPSLVDTGWAFEIIVTDRHGREKTTVIRPWASPLFETGQGQLMAHRLGEAGTQSVQVFTLEQGQPALLGTLMEDEILESGRDRIRLGAFRRYTGLAVYDRPHLALLVIGTLMMMLGLIWHFYHRYRD